MIAVIGLYWNLLLESDSLFCTIIIQITLLFLNSFKTNAKYTVLLFSTFCRPLNFSHIFCMREKGSQNPNHDWKTKFIYIRSRRLPQCNFHNVKYKFRNNVVHQIWLKLIHYFLIQISSKSHDATPIVQFWYWLLWSLNVLSRA